MFSGISLTLMIGPGVPVPTPREVLGALTRVQITTTTEGPSAFQLTFTLSTKSPLHTLFLLSAGTPIPMVRVIVVVTVNGISETLIDGVMTNHEVSPATEPGQATLTVTGEDLTRVMDYVDFSGTPYPGTPPEARVLLILAKYAFLGIVPLVIPSALIDAPIPTNRIPIQQGKDLQYIRQLANEVGYVFYIEPGDVPGMNIAYWGPEIKIGAPQPALNTNMDTHTNVESLTFNFNSESRKLPVILIQNEMTKVPIPIPVPDITILNPQLGSISLIPKAIELMNETANLSPVRAALVGLAEAARSADGVSATGTLNVLRYGHVLKARRLVGVRGAGPAFDGLYYVKSVTHNIKRGEYKQNFTLIRNGLISTVPRVIV